MRELLEITKALSNPNRIRILMALTKGELCVCQIIAFLNLAPSTVSKHLSLLTQARLIENRKEGRWIFYCLSKERKVAKQSIKWIKDSLKEEEIIIDDQKKLKKISTKRIFKLIGLGFLTALATIIDDTVVYSSLFLGQSSNFPFVIGGIFTATLLQLTAVIYLSKKVSKFKYKKEVTSFGLIILGILILTGIL